MMTASPSKRALATQAENAFSSVKPAFRSSARWSASQNPALWRVVSYRSEEHTSELQSLMRISYAVFCLKKKKIIPHHKHTINYMSIDPNYYLPLPPHVKFIKALHINTLHHYLITDAPNLHLTLSNH